MAANTQRAHPATRVLAGIAGSLLILALGLVTLGSAFVACAAVFLGYWLARRKGKRYTRGRAWLYASSAAALVFLVAAGLGVAFLSQEERAEVLTPNAAEATPDIPAWLERFVPAADRQAEAFEHLTENRAVMLYFGVMGGVFGALLFGALLGTLAWACALLLMVAVQGGWPRPAHAPTSPPLPDPPS